MNQKKVMAWVVIILMSLSVLGVVGESFFAGGASSSGKKEYNGYVFYGSSNQWRLQLDNREIYFFNFPEDLEEFVIPFETAPWSTAQKIYLAYFPENDPENDLVVDQYIQFTGSVLQFMGIKTNLACTEETGCPDIPIMDCSEKQGIIFLSGDQAEITQNKSCLVITGTDSDDLRKLTERVIYDLLGVM